MVYDDKNAKRLSIIGERPAFGLAVTEIAEGDPNVVVVVADTTSSAGLERMKALLPEQIINVGIAEQNMMGIATGLASEGYTVITATFAPFQSMRCLEQIRVYQGYMRQKVIMVGLASGVAYGELGFTHCSIEDVSIIGSIPNIAVVTPADCFEVVKCVEAAIKYDRSVYIRLMDTVNVPIVFREDYNFEIGKAVRLLAGKEAAIICNGTMVSASLKAAEMLKSDTGIEAAVYDMHTTKPIDNELLADLIDDFKVIFTVEEHSIHGGLGTAVADHYSGYAVHPQIIKMGIPDEYCHGASHEAILDEYGLTAEGIYKRIKKFMEEKK